MYTVEHHSAIRKDEILPFVTTSMDTENITLSKINQTEKIKNHDFTHIWGIKPKATDEQTKTHRQQ